MRRSPAGAVVVLELQGWVSPGLARLLRGIRRIAADRGVSLIAVTEGHLADLFLGSRDCVVSTEALCASSVVGEPAGFPEWFAHRLRKLAGHRAAVRHDILDATRAWPAEAIADAVEESRSGRAMLDRFTANLLDLSSAAQQEALETCLVTGYWHPQLAGDAVLASELRPWIVPLEGGWGWLRPIWARPLRRCLSGRVGQRRPARLAALVPSGALVSHTALVPSAAAVLNQTAKPAPPPAEPGTLQRGVVEVHLFGKFELSVDGRTVDNWPGQRGTSVLRYLLSRRRHACSRDELLEEFWPDVPPNLARNRLQVAVSGLRRALRQVTNGHVIEYAEGCYRISPELRVETDVARFEGALSRARCAEQAGELDRALVAYGEAMYLYRGDFASDALFEQWTLLPRESHRLAYIDALDRVSRIQLSIGRLDECITTAHRMLDVDPCREDAHRLLMRCYTSQQRIYQAVRQYEFCCRVLKEILQAEPAPETTRLYWAVRVGSYHPP